MGGVKVLQPRIIELPILLRDLKEQGFTSGKWAWIVGTDRIEIRTWRRRKNK